MISINLRLITTRQKASATNKQPTVNHNTAKAGTINKRIEPYSQCRYVLQLAEGYRLQRLTGDFEVDAYPRTG